MGDVVAGQATGNLLLGFQGPDAAFAEVVRRPHAGVLSEAEHVVLPVPPRSPAARGLASASPGSLAPARAARSPTPGEDRVAELVRQRLERIGRDRGKSLVKGGVPGMGSMPRSARCACTGQTAPG